MSRFNNFNIEEFLDGSQIGVWEVTVEKDNIERFYANEMMDKLLGCPKGLSPEERFLFHRAHINKDDVEMFMEYSERLVHGQAEITYRYEHPIFGTMFVRCSGKKDSTIEDYISIKGIHQDISGTFRLEKDKVAEKFLAEKNFHLEEQLVIIQTLAKTYNSIYYLDMKTMKYIEIAAQLEGVRGIIGGAGDAKLAFKEMCEHIVAPEHTDDMRRFVDVTTLNERLEDKLFITKQFKSILAGWSEGVFIAADRNEKGLCEHVIWATRTIDEAKKRELSYQEALRMATKAAQAASDAKSAFLFNMSHDIRTPMNAIIGFADLLEKNIDNAELCKDYISKKKNASGFLLSLINNVLEMARIESGKLSLDEKAWSVKEFCETIYAIFENPMKEKNITLNVDLDVKHQYVFCDQVKLREVYLNIISNAYKYTPEGGTVKLSVKEIDSDRKGYICYEVQVSDTGIGMSKEFLPSLFDEFSRERNHTISKIEGTGLGMPIVKRLIDLMGGKISVESELGLGTTFTIIMYHKEAKEEDLVDVQSEALMKKSFVGKRILLTEDNELNAEIAVEILKEHGFEVEVAVDGVMCIEMLSTNDIGYYDVILMDIQMPNMDGYETTKVIRKFYDENANVPIIAMTANAFEEDKKKAFEVGMNGHLAKPIEINKLLLEMTKILG